MKVRMFSLFLIFLSSLFVFLHFVNSEAFMGTLITGYASFSVNETNTTVPNATISCSNCNSGTCSCSVSSCVNGTLDIYYISNCSMIPFKELVFNYGNLITFSLNKTIYTKILCDNEIASNCTEIDYSPVKATTTTTTSIITNTSTTTTTAIKSSCPYECCINVANYFNKDCDYGKICTNNVCLSTSTTTTSLAPPQYQISFSLIASVFISIFLLVFLIFYVFGYIIGKSSARTVLSKAKK